MIYKQVFFVKQTNVALWIGYFWKKAVLWKAKTRTTIGKPGGMERKQEGRSCEGTYGEKIIHIFYSWIWKPAWKISPSYRIQLLASYSLGVSESHLPHLLTKATCYYSQHSAAHQAVKVGAAVNDVCASPTIAG